MQMESSGWRVQVLMPTVLMDEPPETAVEVAARIQAMQAVLQRRDPHTAVHTARTAHIAMLLGEVAGLDAGQQYVLATAALLHDIGKLSVPMRILEFRGRLDGADWSRMQGHSAVGGRIVQTMGLPLGEQIAQAVRQHHESVDGSGYPDGLRGSEIVLPARIISLADAYDAISAARAYHRQRSHDETMDILAGEVGRKCDGELFALFRTDVVPQLLQDRCVSDPGQAAQQAIERYCRAALPNA